MVLKTASEAAVFCHLYNHRYVDLDCLISVLAVSPRLQNAKISEAASPRSLVCVWPSKLQGHPRMSIPPQSNGIILVQISQSLQKMSSKYPYI
jgi:hypothetical protein